MNRLAFEFCVPAGHPSLAGHFPGNPVVPGVLLLDLILCALQQSAGLSLSVLKQAKFVGALFPGELAHGYWDVADALATFRVYARRGGTEVKLAEGAGTLSPQVLR